MAPSSVAENNMVLASPAQVAQDPFDLRQETHVGHPVGLVEHDVPHVAAFERPAVDEGRLSRPGSRHGDVDNRA